MPRGLRNWTYRDVTAFLKEKGFSFYENRKGSHEAWINKDINKVVEIDFHREKSFPPRTLETMIRQSGILKRDWFDWTRK